MHRTRRWRLRSISNTSGAGAVIRIVRRPVEHLRSEPPKQMVSEFPTARASSEPHHATMALANSGITGLHEAMKMLVLGASGGVGKHLVRLACDQGHIVT